MSRSATDMLGTPREYFHWIPGEVVIVVQLPQRVANGDLDILVEQVRSRLNAVLTRYRLRLEPYGTAGRWRDLPTMPPVRRRAFLFGQRRRFPFAAMFFHVHSTDQPALDYAPSAISYLQEHLDELAQEGLQLASAMPNWLVEVAPSLYAVGGPALPPMPPPPIELAGEHAGVAPGWHLSFIQPAIPPDMRNAQDVVIAVIDTAHHPDRVRSAAMRPELRHNRLLQRMAASLRNNDGLFEIDYDRRYYVTDEAATGRDAADKPRYYLMPDHGLFVAGIARDLAPAARIRLIRVLNDYGGGDLYNLYGALTDLETELVSGTIRNLVINLSLTIMPPLMRLPYVWFNEYSWPSNELPEAIRSLNHIETGLRLLCESLSEAGALIVAAAGNDSLAFRLRGEPPQPPRSPARYESVLSATSVNSQFAPSLFANAANIPPARTGVAAFGGDHAGMTDENGFPDAVRGLYIALTFPNGEQNTSGWADWCGTSFAAPMISALGAHLLAQGHTAADIMHTIAAGQRPASYLFGGTLDAPALLANVVRVRQGFASSG